MKRDRPAAAVVAAALMISLAFPAALAAEQDWVPTVASWIDSMPFDGRAADGVATFARESGGAFSEDYPRKLATGVRRLMSADVARRLAGLSQGNREPFIAVTIMEPGFAAPNGEEPDDKTAREFEKSFIRTEVLAFYPGVDASPESALAIFASPEFRKHASHRIERIWVEEGASCVEVGGVALLLDPLMYCDLVSELHSDGLAVQHTQAVGNPGGEDYQTVYFKESLKTFVRLPDGLAFHYINYSRTIGMGALKRKIARDRIADSEKMAVDALFERLRSPEEVHVD